jgi:RNA polymerase sigma-70 factor, ECF subfamily
MQWARSRVHQRIELELLSYTGRAVETRAGDTGSFEELALPLVSTLYAFACWLTQNRDAAEDLVQETLMKALKGFSSYKQGSNFRAWMHRILRNAFLTSRTGLAAAISLDSEEDALPEPSTPDTPESLLLARLDQETLENALMELPVNHREILLLCDFEEMSYQEIAVAIGIPIGTVMSRLSRARRALRTLLSAKLERAQR